VIALTRRYSFPAAHVLSHPALDAAENRRIYGKCANPAGHGHNYGVEVTVTGPTDPRTGRVIAPETLDRIVAERVLSRFSHRMLNGEPAFAEWVPTAENIARVVYRELEQGLEALSPLRLVRVRVQETRKNTFVCGEPE
jgi:6-pyruvoyltetrahydropterin/6-carboxytetrahydropterin synthase